MFAAWGSAAHRYRVPVLVSVLVAVVAGGIWGLGVFDRMSQGGYEAPGSEGVEASDIADQVSGNSGDVVVLYHAPDGSDVDDPAMAEDINSTLNDLPDGAVNDVTSYWRTPAPQLSSDDGDTGLVSIDLAGDDLVAKTQSYEQISEQLQQPEAQADIAGEVPMQQSVEEHAQNDLVFAEAVSMPVVLALLVVIFGGFVAAALPVLVGGLAVFGALGLLNGISMFTDVNVFAVNVASLLGLGLAIDYGLFIVGRFREELAAERSVGDAVRRSVASAGRTVAFSATLLVIALAGLILFPQSFLKSLAYGGMSAVALAAVISLTLLPALLGVLGHRVNKLAVRKNIATPRKNSRWGRFANAVMKRPVLTAVPIIALLAALGAPFLSAQYGTPDERMLPPDDSSRQAIETLRDEFPAMNDNSIQVIAQGPHDAGATQRFLHDLAEVPGVDDVRPSGQDGDTTVFTANISGDPFGDGANQTVRDIRGLNPPGNSELLVGGPTATNLDSLAAVQDAIPWVAGLLVVATAVIMFLAFGSVLLPLKAVVMSVLSISATFGVLTWIFVGGHGAGLLGVTPAPMEVGVVVLMASVVFGLSTDYEVLLLSRMVEARTNGASTREAVRSGITSTGGVITAAALLLIVVTGAFAFSGLSIMRFIGVGMIFALALDATVVRMLLVPAVLKLFGRAAWWAPGPLRRVQRAAAVSEDEEESAEQPREPVTSSN